jgi:hypothetical protein
MGQRRKTSGNWLTKRLVSRCTRRISTVWDSPVGGRWSPRENPTALFMYENGDKHRLSLQARKPGRYR